MSFGLRYFDDSPNTVVTQQSSSKLDSVFAPKYFAELRSKYKEVFWRAEIHERGYTGSVEEMAFDGSSPLSITWEKRGDEFYIPVKGSEATIDILCKHNFHYINLFTSDPRRFRVSVYRNTKLYWRGYVVADLYSENFTAPPYTVTIKAVDGFNLLASVPFFNIDNSQIVGRKSLWELLSMCFDLLELDIPIADWMDLYAESMSESISPLRQVYIDMARFYYVYNEPTYRDILELCLRPFSAQIFQSNGALHIRRSISLYNDTRPMSFYDVGNEFPTGWLVTADGRNLMNHSGEPIITESTRERIESMWQEGLKVDGSTTLDIIPAIRKVRIQVRNKLLTNIVPHIGLYDLTKWSDPNEFLSLRDGETLRFAGDSARQGEIIEHSGYLMQQCSYILKIEFTLRSYYRRWGSMGSQRPVSDYKVKVEYGFKVIGADKTYYLQDDGQWVNHNTTIIDEVNISNEMNKKIDANGIPCRGRFVFFIKQTMISTSSSYSSTEESCDFKAINITIDTNNEYEDSLKYEVDVNRANNVDMDISLPIADITNIPNDQLIYSLYFTDSSGKPTRMWHSKGGNDYNSLINHIVTCALKYKQLASRRISGDVFTGKHLDMNSVLQDDTYLKAGFYINSIELNALNDISNSELVEMPKLLARETPPAGEDCVKIADLEFTIINSLRCENQIILHATNNKIYRYDSSAERIIEVCSVASEAKIYPADNSFVVVDSKAITVINYKGAVIRTIKKYDYNYMATYMGGYIYNINKWTDSRVPPRPSYYYIIRPEYKYVSNYFRRGIGEPTTDMYGDITRITKSFSSIAISTTERSYLHDRRTNTDLTMHTFDDGADIISLSDYFICANFSSQFRIYRRDTISFEDKVLVKTITGSVTLADHTLGEVAYMKDSTVSVWTYRTNTVKSVRNPTGASQTTKGLFYINGELYIVRTNSLFKKVL